MAFLDLTYTTLSLAAIAEKRRALAELAVKRLLEAERRVSTAESCTGGLVAYSITEIPGASGCFDFGAVTYANKAKEKALGVPPDMLLQRGAVSEETARAMAKGAMEAACADFGVSTTGIAGPGGGTKEKPVGLVWIGAAGKESVSAKRIFVPGKTREYVRQYAAGAALEMLLLKIGEA